MNSMIPQLVELFGEDVGYKVNENGGIIKARCGYMKADRACLKYLFGYIGGSSPDREGICEFLFMFNRKNIFFVLVQDKHICLCSYQISLKYVS